MEKINKVEYGLIGIRSAPKSKVMTAKEYQDSTKNKFAESDLQTKICKWLKVQYPGLIFFSDFAAGMYISNPVIRSVRSLQSCDGKYLDLTILKAVGGYNGLILELKVDADDLFLVDGKTLKSDHVREQYDMILKLRSEGYASDFAAGEYNIKLKIIDYMTKCFTNFDIIYKKY